MALPFQLPDPRLTAAEALALITRNPKLPMAELVAAAPRGDGHAVLVLPGMLRGDPFTDRVREFLIEIGYAAFGWNLGINFGPTKYLVRGASERLIGLSERHGPVSVVGFSMGGLFARLLAVRMPERVRRIVTVCSPIGGYSFDAWIRMEPAFRILGGDELSALAEEIRHPMPVPCTAVYSRDDGLVGAASSIDPAETTETVEITGPHVLAALNADVYTILGRTLAKPARN